MFAKHCTPNSFEGATWGCFDFRAFVTGIIVPDERFSRTIEYRLVGDDAVLYRGGED